MRRARISAVVFILAVAVPAALFALNGQVLYTEGTVTVTSAGAAQEAAPGVELSAGDAVATGPASLAVIDLSNATQLKLRENTSVTISAIGDDTSVSLSSGGVFTRILRKLSGTFTVHADTTVAGARGTEFFVAFGRTVDARPDVWLCVNSGAVEVSLENSAQSVVVSEGRGINIVGGRTITPPRRYRWTRDLNWNMDPAAGKVEDTTSLDNAYSDLLNHDYN